MRSMARRDSNPSADDDQMEALQLAAEPLRTWVGDGKGGRVRPVMGVLVARRSRYCLAMDMAKPDEAPYDVAGRVLAKALKSAELPPQARIRVQVRDPELATVLRRRIDLSAAEFEVVEALEAVDSMLAEMEHDLFPQRIAPPLEQPGMSVERLRAFAAAAAAFYAARPWQHLHDDDLIETTSPKPPAAMRYVSVLGAGGQVQGIGFWAKAGDYDRLLEAEDRQRSLTKNPRWSLMFHAPDEMPPDDAELWQAHGLRVAADESAPVLLRYHGGGEVDRPDGPTLTFVEGLCRALAATTEAEIDAGRWEKSVETFDGPATYRFAIPHLLDTRPAGKTKSLLLSSAPAVMERSMQQIIRMIQQSGAQSVEEMNALLDANVNGRVLDGAAAPSAAGPKERAMDLCYEAQEQWSRRAYQLLQEALRLDPDCAEAYVLLARRQSDPAAAEPLYRRAVEAGRRSLGEEAFDDPEFPFWGALESRPFMRALSGLAEALERQGRLADSAEILGQMLKLNPGDNQGARYLYVPQLIALGRLDEADAVIGSEEYADDVCALWDFAAALIEFKQGRRPAADSALKAAAKRNRHVIPLLLHPERVPPGGPPSWSPGTESEALMVADLLGDLWRSDPAAVEWLIDSAKHLTARPTRGKSAKGRSTKGKGKRKPRGG